MIAIGLAAQPLEDLHQAFAFFLAKRQFAVARGTAEAEYREMALNACEVTWLKQLLRDLGLKNETVIPIMCDNQAALAISANPVHHEKTKHVDINCHFIRDKTVEGVIQPTHIPSFHQVADVFTKVLPTHQQSKLLSKLGVQSGMPAVAYFVLFLG